MKELSRFLRLGLIPLFLMVSLTAQDCTFGGAEPCTANCGPPWSPDGDLFSDSVELNEANRFPQGFYDLHPDTFDVYTGVAHGTTGSGFLEDGVNFKDESTGYIHYLGTDHPTRDEDDWATIHMINLMEAVGRYWDTYSTTWNEPLMMVGDASRRLGGFMSGHTHHSNGTELDVRYIRHDHSFSHFTHLDPCGDPAAYDTIATQEVLAAYLALGEGISSERGEVDKILVGRCMGFDAPGFDPRLVVDNTGGHDNHFHVRIKKP